MGLQDFMFQVGMMAVHETMAAEVETLAGPRYKEIPINCSDLQSSVRTCNHKFGSQSLAGSGAN